LGEAGGGASENSISNRPFLPWPNDILEKGWVYFIFKSKKFLSRACPFRNRCLGQGRNFANFYLE
jgi:hypothetical protein